METIDLAVQKRDTEHTAQAVRDSGMIPGICYGAGEENQPVQVEYQIFRKCYKVAGENTVIDLDIAGKKHKVLVHELQWDPVFGDITHIDFKYIDMKKPVVTHVPVVTEGESPAVKDLAGILTMGLTEIEVKCLPADIPHEFIINIEALEDFHSAIHVSDVTAPEGVEILSDLERTIATVSAPRVEEEEPEMTEEEAIAALAGEEGEEGAEGEGGEGGEGGEAPAEGGDKGGDE